MHKMQMLKGVGKKEEKFSILNGLPTFYTVDWANFMLLWVIESFILTTFSNVWIFLRRSWVLIIVGFVSRDAK